MRRQFLAVAAAISALVVGAGCRSVGNYMGNRAADLADVFTAELTFGPGVEAHAQVTGFLGTSLGYSDQKGLMLHGRHRGTGRRWSGGLLVLGGTETTAPQMRSLWGEQVHQERRGLWAMFLPLAYSPGEGISVAYLPGWPRTADVEFGASAGVGFHVGLSPGELLDFLLGFSTLDVAGDDVTLHPPASPPTEGNPPIILWPHESSGPSWVPR